MKDDIFFSIIIPVFNGSKTLRLVLESILNQNYKYFEVIIYDDCSTDNSMNILHDCFKDSKINYKLVRSKEKKGTFYGWREGLNKSKGGYTVVSPQDNVMRNDRLYILNKEIKANNKPKIVSSDVCAGKIKELKSKWIRVGFSLARIIPLNTATLFLFKSSLFAFDTVVIRRSENKYFNQLEKFSPSEDFAFISVIIHTSDTKNNHLHINLPLVYKIFDKGSQTYTNARKISLSSKEVIRSSKPNWLLSFICCSAIDNLYKIRMFSIKAFIIYLASQPIGFIFGSIVNGVRVSGTFFLAQIMSIKQKKYIQTDLFFNDQKLKIRLRKP